MNDGHVERRAGKIRFRKHGPLDIELRVATVPTANGVEDIVMRILPHNLARLKTAIEKPYGLFFVCGPTGSGKTTTLHPTLHTNSTPASIVRLLDMGMDPFNFADA